LKNPSEGEAGKDVKANAALPSQTELQQFENSATARLVASISRAEAPWENSATAKLMEQINRLQTQFDNSTTAKLMESISRVQAPWENSATAKLMDQINRFQAQWDNGAAAKLMASINRSQEFFKPNGALSSLLTSLAVPENFLSAVEIVGGHQVSQLYDLADCEIPAAPIHDDSSRSKSFTELFSQIPQWLQVLVLFIFLQVIVPQLNSISANLLTPHVDRIVSDDSLTDREKVTKIKNIDRGTAIYIPSDLRFIAGERVWLRSEPSASSDGIDLLALGQVVVFIDKKRNWTKVMVEYDGDVVSGWVFTRYVRKFKSGREATSASE